METNNNFTHRRGVIGNESTFWRYSSKTGFDLTHPRNPGSPSVSPSVTIETSTSPIKIDPAKSALLIIDMQNTFLSPALGKAQGSGHAAAKQLIDYAIPACRKAGIRVVWVNWGLTDEDVHSMPPGVKRAFGFEAVKDGSEGKVAFQEKKHGFGVDKDGHPFSSGGDITKEEGAYVRADKGIGSHMGTVKDPVTGEEIDAGRLLMRDTWNAALYPPLAKIFEAGTKLERRPDVWIHKNRMSGMWGTNTLCEQFLEKEGIKTLFFAGVNTDQCVGGTYQDCFSKGYDCVLLGDGCGTTSPDAARQGIEYNSANTWGFLTSCENLANGVARMFE